MKRSLCLWSICAVLGLFGAGCGDDSSDSGAEVPAMTCKDKKAGDKCNADGTKTCQAVEGKTDLECKDKPAASEDPCKGKNAGDKCNADGSKTCQKVEGKKDLECKDKPTASEDPCKGKNAGDKCNADGTKTCQKVEGKEGLQCEDKPVEIDDPCKGKNPGDNCKEDGSMTCQAVEGKTDLECKDAVVDPNKCTPGITRCVAGDSQGVELCMAGGTWGPMTACQEENGVKTTCFKVGENKAECHRPCGKSAKEGENATCQQTGDVHESEVTVCAKAIGGELYVVEKKVYPCHSACTDGKCDFVNFCLKAADSNGGPSCVVLNGMGYYGVCEGNKLLYPEDSWACADANPVIGYGCPAGLTTCGCSNDSECPAGKTCVLPDANGHGNFCKGPND